MKISVCMPCLAMIVQPVCLWYDRF